MSLSENRLGALWFRRLGLHVDRVLRVGMKPATEGMCGISSEPQRSSQRDCTHIYSKICTHPGLFPGIIGDARARGTTARAEQQQSWSLTYDSGVSFVG